MQLLIPFAGVLSEAGRAASRQLVLPQLQGLLQCLEAPSAADKDDEDPWSLSPPHERALALACGWQAADGCLPWAARLAAAAGFAVPQGSAWGLVTPVHWHVGTDQVSLLDPKQLLLDDAASRVLFTALKDLFEGLGMRLHYGHATQWFATHEMLADLPTASLDRVIGRNVDRWLGLTSGNTAAGSIRRLQAEAQMVLYTHPLNDERQARRLLPVNSFWLSGCGRAPAVLAVGMEPEVDERLREPALSENWAAWLRAWETLDAGPIALLHEAARKGQAVQLTLCGERAAHTLRSAAPGWLNRLKHRLASRAVGDVLEPL